MRKFVSFSTLFSVLIVSLAFAQIPQTMSYQGVLTGADGNPVADGNVSLTFKLYDAATGGTALWEETQQVTTANGLFNAILGSVNPLNLPFDKPYWLGITVGQGSEMTPRIALTASPYSLGATATVTQPAAGQSFVVRDATGNTTHVLSANGDVRHTGVGTFLGGIVVGDTVVVPVDTTGKVAVSAADLKKNSVSNIAGNLRPIGLESPGTQIGVFGVSFGRGTGVQGQSSDGLGVLGFSGNGAGVKGRSGSGTGVEGSSDDGAGVKGRSTSGTGVEGSSDDGIAVLGRSSSGLGVSGVSENGIGTGGLSTSGVGVFGLSESNTGAIGQSTSGKGVVGKSDSKEGVFGSSVTGRGVGGFCLLGPGVVGKGFPAGWFQGLLKVDDVPPAPNQERFLVWDADSLVKYRTLPAMGGDGWLVDPQNNLVTTGHNVLIQDGQGNVTTSFNADGTSLHKGDETFEGDVILKGTNGKGIKLVDAAGTTLAGFGRKDLQSGQGLGVFATAANPGDLAGAFEGPVEVTGDLFVTDANGDTLTIFRKDGTSFHKGKETFAGGIDLVNSDGTKAISMMIDANPNNEYTLKVKGNLDVSGILAAGTKQFKIDHPLDPENKYLTHTSVESSDMMNIYNGNVTLDNTGAALVEMPDWFEALNGDFRYQLTAIGAPAPDLYIAEEIQNNRFKIAGGRAGMKVSWQVTGIRHDAWAQEHRQPVEGYK